MHACTLYEPIVIYVIQTDRPTDDSTDDQLWLGKFLVYSWLFIYFFGYSEKKTSLKPLSAASD